MVLGVPIPDFQVITGLILIIVMAIKLLMYERNAFFDKKSALMINPPMSTRTAKALRTNRCIYSMGQSMKISIRCCVILTGKDLISLQSQFLHVYKNAMSVPGGTGEKEKQFEGTSANSIKVSLTDLDAVRMMEIFRILW